MVRHLFDALPEVHRRVTRASRLLLGLDFDGTLTPIVNEPDDALLSPEMRVLLRELASGDNTTVAILSGRSLDDVRQRVGLPALIYAGNHGLEIAGPGIDFVEQAAASRQAALRQVADELSARLVPMAVVEDKGLTATVHVRQTPTVFQGRVRQIVEECVAAHRLLFHVTTGDMVHEIRPRVNWNKGAALRWIQQRLGMRGTAVVYLGDDDTDEDAFAALPNEITVRVGHSPATLANYRLANPDEVAVFLSRLADHGCCLVREHAGRTWPMPEALARNLAQPR
jgi:trehalose 6-phosphate phosphatase